MKMRRRSSNPGKERWPKNSGYSTTSRKRFRKGAVNFETTEVKFKLDEKGKPLAVVPTVRKDAHKLIEEFMLLANKQVARFIYNQKKEKTKTHLFIVPTIFLIQRKLQTSLCSRN